MKLQRKRLPWQSCRLKQIDLSTAVDSMEAETIKKALHIVKRLAVATVRTVAWRDAHNWSMTVKTPSLKVRLQAVRRRSYGADGTETVDMV